MTEVGNVFLGFCSPSMPHVSEQLNIRNSHVRANLARALVRLSPDGGDSSDPGQQVLRQLFGLGEWRL